ncbi:MAG TPA: tyrosine-type recombinase/integrase [Micropepsaceae bacterium]|nr:tyrosine-type recombinase/integrase [Micropepsaceae bacterium]
MRIVDALQPGQTAWDSELRGFGIRCQGTSKTYSVKYRVGGGTKGRQRWFTLGKHGALTPETARKMAQDVLELVRKGKDPAEDRTEHRKALTIAEFWALYDAQHVSRKKPRTAEEYRALARAYILPKFGDVKIVDLARTNVARWHSSDADLLDKPYRANRALALLFGMMTKAEEWGYRPAHTNPCEKIAKHAEEKRKRFLSAEEMARLGASLGHFEANALAPLPALSLIRLLLFTGMRLSEGLNLRWQNVSMGGAFIHLKESKTGAKTVPLPLPARDMLAAFPRAKGDAGNLVFPGRDGASPLQGIQKIWQRIRKHAGLDDVRIHDLRHSFASVAAQSGVSLYVTGAILGHKDPKTTQRYSHLDITPVLAAAESTAATLEAQLSGKPAADLVPIQRHRKQGRE